MEKQSLPTDVKRRLHLRGVAEAWLKWPWAYDRELAAASQALDEGEEVGGVFDVHPGRWTIHSGLLFVTDRRLLYVTYRWCRQSVLSVEFETIVKAVILPDGKDQDLVIETAPGERLYFRSGRGRMKYFSPLFDLLGARLGARVIREGELPDDVLMNPTRVVIKEVPADAREEVIDGKTYLRGRTLGSYLEDFGGFEGEVTQHTTGRRFGISLEPWRGRDPQTTRLDVSFITDL